MIFADGIANARQDKFIDEPSAYGILASNGKYDRNRGGTKRQTIKNVFIVFDNKYLSNIIYFVFFPVQHILMQTKMINTSST